MPISRLSSIATMLATASLFLCGQAGATTVTTTNVNTWKSSSFITGGYSTVDFYPVQQASYSTPAGLTLTPAGSSISFNFTGLDNGSYYLAGDSSQKALLGSSDAGAYINIAMPTSGENAFLVGTGATASHPLTLTLSDGQSFSLTTGAFGVSISHSISWLTLSAAPGSQALVSDFWFAASALAQDAPGGGSPAPNPAATPEPATILMTCIGAALLIAGSKKGKASLEQAS